MWRGAALMGLMGLMGLMSFGDAFAQSAGSAPTKAAVLRCGWFENPTPANAWLTDRDGEWTIAVQGGHQAEGDWPRFTRARWVRTQASYGYGCACLKLVADAQTHTVTRIVHAASRPLHTCRRDRALPKPQTE